MKQAGKIFLTLDTDLDGYLKGSELDKMVTWVLNFHQPDGASHLTVDQKIIYKNELMSMIDKDTNGKISLDEFSTLFEQLRKDKARDRKSKGELFPFQ
jgi:Ca2+-binding EF-hand superfamily protein